MIRTHKESSTRRDWLIGFARGSVLVALAGLVHRITSRESGGVDASGEPCRKPTVPCQTCGLLPQCGVPRAAAARDAGGEYRGTTRVRDTQKGPSPS